MGGASRPTRSAQRSRHGRARGHGVHEVGHWPTWPPSVEAREHPVGSWPTSSVRSAPDRVRRGPPCGPCTQTLCRVWGTWPTCGCSPAKSPIGPLHGPLVAHLAHMGSIGVPEGSPGAGPKGLGRAPLGLLGLLARPVAGGEVPRSGAPLGCPAAGGARCREPSCVPGCPGGPLPFLVLRLGASH